MTRPRPGVAASGAGYLGGVSPREGSLAPSLLLAMPDLADPNFRRAVVLLVHHDQDGTVGLVLNRPTDVRAADLCETLGVRWSGTHDAGVHWGGPVQPNTGWVLAGDGALGEVGGVTDVAAGIHFAGTLEALRMVAEEPPSRLRIFLGYAGWGPGQLEGELAQGAWVVAPLSPGAVFDVPPDELWDHAWRLLGIDPATVVSTPGVH
jgi:putative transcriptional regulator